MSDGFDTLGSSRGDRHRTVWMRPHRSGYSAVSGARGSNERPALLDPSVAGAKRHFLTLRQ